ncbi:MAG: ribosome maturation factor RimM [Deltaproteobacteria bacterium]
MSKTDSRSAAKATLVKLGSVRRAHGINGGLLADIDPSLDEVLQAGLQLRIGGKGFDLRSANRHGKSMLLALDQVNTRDQAEELGGADIHIDPDLLPDAGGDGHYYDFEILGASVATNAGRQLGSITEILRTGANDVYVVSPSGGQHSEILVPAVAGTVLSIDKENKKIIVDPTRLVYPADPKGPA